MKKSFIHSNIELVIEVEPLDYAYVLIVANTL
ncbi:hypothetical protein Cpin_4214 [Chitinophaga pinensis DSM 2588]|uniref:Uncharacterized protein n=1 Tax=Chitinophaga pinensis (strain ATCC 43595 / DSM 2588 / LMG 13176 / NBRC 15968 / NCIMB 11800 / UQM 2034) TaxID=485918 RepID=A0A979GWB2_CHIPD|nr:hypothetical protein Cpin_4214 [Chitinophaga pinensis DSM 2588]